MLPYASYLRVYEPIYALAPELRESLCAGEIGGKRQLPHAGGRAASRAHPSRHLVDDQHRAEQAVRRLRDAPRGPYFFCPVDMPLRSWLSMTSLIDAIGGSAAGAIVAPETLALADEDFLRWRRDNPQAVPHIRQVTWGVPRTWFTLVVEDERTGYTDATMASVRYRARILDARSRAAYAHRTLRKAIDDSALLAELGGLGSWLATFHHDSWVEVDYAGVAQLLGESPCRGPFGSRHPPSTRCTRTRRPSSSGHRLSDLRGALAVGRCLLPRKLSDLGQRRLRLMSRLRSAGREHFLAHSTRFTPG